MTRDSRLQILSKLEQVHARLKNCAQCEGMCGAPVHGPAIVTSIMAVGQAPGPHEEKLGRPFAFTAGKTLFRWLKGATGLEEAALRERIYFTAVARCFPGKAMKGGGDRVPSSAEILRCSTHLRAEVAALRPRLLLCIGRLAIAEVLGPALFSKGTPLHEVVGRKFTVHFHGIETVAVPLPHPSGVSTWTQTEPGRTKLAQALRLLKREMKSAAGGRRF